MQRKSDDTPVLEFRFIVRSFVCMQMHVGRFLFYAVICKLHTKFLRLLSASISMPILCTCGICMEGTCWTFIYIGLECNYGNIF